MLDYQRELINANLLSGLGAMSVAKFRALLIWQDRLRHQRDHMIVNLEPEVASYGNYNPIWEVGDIARQNVDANPAVLGMDADTQGKKLAGPTIKSQLSALRVSWLWAGWQSDQGLFKTSHDDKTRLGMWLSQSLSEDGPYPIHNVFVNARRQAVVSNDAASWGEPSVRRRRIWDMAGLRSFSYQLKDTPTNPEHLDLLTTFTANCFRMNLLLLQDELLTTHAVWVKANSSSNVDELVNYIVAKDPDDAPSAQKLGAELHRLIDAAHERNQFAPAIPPK